MAYADRAALVQSVQTSAQQLGAAAAWASGASVSVRSDFLYEMYVLFRLVEALQTVGYTVRYVTGTPPTEHEFPKGPAKKAGRPRFEIADDSGDVRWQLCAGTKAQDLVGKRRGLDISLQVADASDDPTAVDVEMIWDAKFRTNPVDRITSHEFAELARWVELFGLRGVQPPAVDLGTLEEMLGNCLVTNGRFSTEPIAELNRVSLREVESFAPVSPTIDARP
jgi:hypothetical protein